MNVIGLKNINVFLSTSLIHVATKEMKVKDEKEAEDVKSETSSDDTTKETPSMRAEASLEDKLAENEMKEEKIMEEGKDTVEDEVVMNEEVPFLGEGEVAPEMEMNMGMDIPADKPSLMQNTGVLIGITAGVLALGILAGIVLAKLRIKKGINLYED